MKGQDSSVVYRFLYRLLMKNAFFFFKRRWGKYATLSLAPLLEVSPQCDASSVTASDQTLCSSVGAAVPAVVNNAASAE